MDEGWPDDFPASEQMMSADGNQPVISMSQASVEDLDSPLDGSENQSAPKLPYPVVAFGASAGGLTAFREILDHLPAETGMTYVLVTHLAPDQKSYLTEIMERHTRMPVAAIEQDQRPEPDHLYILLPNQYVRLVGGRFQLEERKATDRIPSPVDTFFRSLAQDQRNLAIGVVLSGADSDGAQGLKAIKGEGGIALVQSPDSAQNASMPRNSIAADHVDRVLPPEELALELARLAYQSKRPQIIPLESGEAPEDDASFQTILRILRNHSGIDLRLYKQATIRRRLARRMMLMRMDTMADYLKVLQIQTPEVQRLQDDILIGVTRFFRDTEVWNTLQADVLPSLFRDRPQEKQFRVWCAGCSSGEEVYSLAIAVLEYVSQSGLDTPIQIFGTDASERSIEMARNAIYPDSIASEVSPDRIRRFFVKVDRGYQVSKRVRDLCIFARQNLSTDPPFSHIDLLSCRNVMIYLDALLQRQLVTTFHYALETGGYMMLGLSEGLREFNELFLTVDRKQKIYSKIGNSTPNTELYRIYRNISMPSTRQAMPDEVPTWSDQDLQRAADRIAIARYSPPGMIIDDRMNVLQLRGQVSEFFEPGPGAVSWNLQRILRGDIATHVSEAVQRSIRTNLPTQVSFPVFDSESKHQQLQVDVLPIGTGGSQRCFLLFLQVEAKGPENATTQPSPALSDDERERLIAIQREELASTRIHLQSLIEERDARNQELVSANEEIQAANEELQSTNEELGTTKEELQSANEELQTVNDELQQRNHILAQTGNDLNNLLNSVNIPLLMLSSDLRIRQFTPPMQRLVSVRPSDVGRPISEIRLHLSIENLEELLLEVLDTLETREVEVTDRDGRWYSLRIRPYRTSDDKIEGVVLILMDINQLRSSKQTLMDARDFARSVVDSMPLPVSVLRPDLTIETVNAAFGEIAHIDPRALIGRSFPDLSQHLWGFKEAGKLLSALLEADSLERVSFEHQSSTADQKALSFTAAPFLTDKGLSILLIVDDITTRKKTEHLLNQERLMLSSAVQAAADKLERSQEELRSLTSHLFTVQEEERRRVARELHDDVSQQLAVLEMLLNDLNSGGSEQAAVRLEKARQHLQSVNTSVRGLSHELHPAILDDLGLSAALKALVSDFRKREEMEASYISRNVPELKTQPAVTAIYRITQEALHNVAKHAGKTHVKVILEARAQTLHLEVVDLGVGFDQEVESLARPLGLGMISMKERAYMAHGTFSVKSTLGYGTTVTAEIPFDAA